MTSKNNLSLNTEIYNKFSDDEIDFKEIFFTLLRNKKLIGIFALSGIALGTLIAFTSKRVWQGEFQIVLEESKPKNSIIQNPSIAKVAGLSSKSDSLKTEVGILRSQLVLMNIFEFVKTEKKAGGNNIDNLRFKLWKNDLNIKLEKDTSILNLSYRDTDKELILPVLNRISTAYQEYSGKQRLRDIELGVNYFKDQIKIYKVRSFESLRKAQEFATEEDLTILQNESGLVLDVPNQVNVEAIRVDAANEIRLLDQRLIQIANSKNAEEESIHIGATIPALRELSKKLRNFDSYLESLRLRYKENYKLIRDLKKERELLVDLSKKQVEGYLLAKKANAESRLKAAERPQGVLIKYRELLTNANRDQFTLDNLNSQYRSLLLEKARVQDPWELITSPTLLSHPVAPERKKLIMIGLLAGSILGSVFALINERRKGIIFSLSEMKSIMKCPMLAKLSLNKRESWEEDLEIIVTGPLTETKGSIALMAVGELETSTLNHLSQSLKKCLKERDFLITKKITEATQYQNIVIVTELGITSKEEFIETQEKILLVKRQLLGSLILNGRN